MELQEVDKQRMESLKALSDLSIKHSEAQNALFKLQEEETEYLVAREKKAMDRIQKTIEDSQELVKEADQNYSQIKALISGVSDFSQKLVKILGDFQSLKAEFDSRNEQWERDIGKQQDDIAEIRKQQKSERVRLENEQKNLDNGRKKLENDQKKLDSERGTVERAIKRLKENRI